METSRAADDFVRTLVPALRQAAAIARALEGRVANHPKQDEPSAVKAALTVADTAAQEALLVPLLAHFRDVRLDAEESTPSVDRFTGSTHGVEVVIDPIDGTLRFFLQRRGPYAIMAGLAIAGRYEASLVALPREELFCEATRGAASRLAQGRQRFRAARLDPDARRILVSHDLPEPARERLREAGYQPEPGCGGAIAIAPIVPGFCGGVRLAAPGGSISRRGRIGLLASREAGAVALNGTGKPFPESIDAPEATLVVAASGEHAEALLRAVGG